MFPIKVKLKLKLKLKFWPTKPFFLTLTCVFTANSEFIQPFLQTVTFYIQNWLLRDAIHYMKVQARTQDFFWGGGAGEVTANLDTNSQQFWEIKLHANITLLSKITISNNFNWYTSPGIPFHTGKNSQRLEHFYLEK